MTEDEDMTTATATKNFQALDAGEMREFLAEQLAEWKAAEFKDSSFSRIWFRRVAILARRTRQRRGDVITQLNADAEAMA
jgi:macrodomain Ter protein organizer (MatP/YcbG family)